VGLRLALSVCVIAYGACSPSGDKADAAPDWRRVPVSLELSLAESAPAPGLEPAMVYGQPDTLYLHPQPRLSGDHIARVEAAKTMGEKGLVLAVWFTKAGARQLADMTGNHIGDTLAVLINSVVVSAPVIQETMGGDTKLPSHIGVPLDPTAARQLALAISKTWPPVPAASKRDGAKDAR
jgi:preprotein translocase subunit SecD